MSRNPFRPCPECGLIGRHHDHCPNHPDDPEDIPEVEPEYDETAPTNEDDYYNEEMLHG